MDEKQFWQQKIVQFFHDPPGKPYASWPGTGGHKKVAADLFERYTRLPLKGYATYPDRAASGADRPLITPEEGAGSVQVHWWTCPILTHPLAAGYRLDVRRSGQEEPEARAETKDAVLEDQIIEVEQLAEMMGDWGDEKHLRKGFLELWRRFRDDLVFEGESGQNQALSADLLWAEMPADSRYPDHSIWDHLRVTTALAFLTRRAKDADHPQAPWLLRFSIGPVQRFIEEARTTRDLWTGSFLLSDLIWHAMEPIVKQYGPDCIIYPDLRGNPLMDVWLFNKDYDALPRLVRDPSSYAAMLPNAFVALVPRGGEGHLCRLETLAEQAQAAMQSRWQELAQLVFAWIRDIPDIKQEGAWIHTWQRQQGQILYSTWSAVPWLPLEKIKDPHNLRGRALPAQRKDFRTPPPERAALYEQDRQNIQARRERLEPWVPNDVWARYEWAREVYALTNLNFHQMERGFDYALTHHQLSVRHALRKATAPDPLPQGEGEPGEKCTLCGKRTALGGELNGQGIESARNNARQFWSHEKLDPDRTGSERLCAVCATKRFLVEAGYDKAKGELSGINPLWAGPKMSADEVLDDNDKDKKVRMPSPSSATLAAQKYLEALVGDAALVPHLEAVNRTHRATGLPRTSFPRALPRLAAAYWPASGPGKDFLMREAQEVVFPDAVEGVWRYWDNKAKQDPQAKTKAARFLDLLEAVQELHKAARQRHGVPNTRIAVVMLDGDQMSRLLLGEAEAIGARWRDVIHPQALEQITANPHLRESGWLDLLDAKRLMGPSLHAFISRALAHFNHRIVPWVVEREFSGRLIYTGGDDVLCLAPAEDALSIAARLQQLYSAPWVIDTDYRADPWPWRRRQWQGSYDQAQARRRFLIPEKPPDDGAIRFPDESPLEPHATDPDLSISIPSNFAVLPMLGPHCSLSAGIAYGHYKTSLGALRAQAHNLLERLAKGRAGRRAVALSHFSRNGAKTEFAMRWSETGPPTAQHCLRDVCRGFATGGLPNRLPYKLRDLMPLVHTALEQLHHTSALTEEAKLERRERLLRGLFQEALDEPSQPGLQQDAYAIWKAGIELHGDETTRAVDGLLLCRYLAGGEEDAAWPDF